MTVFLVGLPAPEAVEGQGVGHKVSLLTSETGETFFAGKFKAATFIGVFNYRERGIYLINLYNLFLI